MFSTAHVQSRNYYFIILLTRVSDSVLPGHGQAMPGALSVNDSPETWDCDGQDVERSHLLIYCHG